MNEIRRDIYRVFRKMSIGANQSLSKHAVLSRRRRSFSADETLAEMDRMVDEGRLQRSEANPDHYILTAAGHRESLTA